MALSVYGLRKRCLDDFNQFLILFTDDGFYGRGVHQQVAQFLADKTCPKKGLVLPRSFLKTHVISRYMVWVALNDPEVRMLYVSNSADNAERVVRAIRTMFESDNTFRTLFSDHIPVFSKVKWSDSCAVIGSRKGNYMEGTWESAGTNTRIIGKHFTHIIEDDTVAPAKDDMTGDEIMPSPEMVDQAVGWHKLSTPLLVNTCDTNIVCGTRWRKDDLIDWVEKNQEEFKWLNLKALDDNGNPIYPERFGHPELKVMESNLGSYLFSSLYKNNPLSGEHILFGSELFRYVEGTPEGQIMISVDPAISENKRACFTVVMAGSVVPGRLIVEEYRRFKGTPNKTIDVIFEMAMRYKCKRVLIESVAYQMALVLSVRNEMAQRGYFFVVEEIKSRRAKEERIRGLQPHLENARILFRKGIKKDLENELRSFPYGKYLDCADALEMLSTKIGVGYPEPLPESDAPPVQEVIDRVVKMPTFSVKMEDIIEELRSKGKQAWVS